VHPQKKFPHVSLLFLGTLTFLFALLFKLKTVIAAVLAMRLIIQFIGQAVGVMLLRRRWPPERLPFKMWLYPLPALLTIAGWIWLFLRTGRAIWWGLFVILLGLAVFLVQSRLRREWPFAAPTLGAAE
jgi:amino acid transporter